MQIPYHDGAVITATGQLHPIGMYSERLDRSLMRFLHPHALPTLSIPPGDHSITVSADQQIPVWTPGHCIDDTAMSHKTSRALPTLHIPYEDLPVVAAPATTGQLCTIGTPGYVHDYTMVPQELLL